MFITVVQGTTKAYTKRKARIKNSRKRFLENKIQSLEKNENPQVLQTQEYSYYKGLLNEIIMDEIRGHDIWTRCKPKFKLNEPDISTYSNFEKRYQSKHIIHQLKDEKNDTYTDKNSILKITQKYYKKLFKSSKTNSFK